jgi:site-specific recombinase XerD
MADGEKWGLSREEIDARIREQNEKHQKKEKGRSQNQRLKLFYLRDYLLEHTDETHTVKVQEIISHFENYHKIPVEQKTGKRRVFTVPLLIWQYIENYCLRNGIKRTELIFPITERAVQKQLKIVCDYLRYEGISTHSFRKWYATEIYNANGFDIALVQRLLQHSSASTTQRYIGIEPQRIEQAIQNHAQLL